MCCLHVSQMCIHIAYIMILEYVCILPLGPPMATPQFDYCISYNDGQPALQVTSYVCAWILYQKLIYLKYTVIKSNT